MERAIVVVLVLVGLAAACKAGAPLDGAADQNALSEGAGTERDAATDSGGEPAPATDAGMNVGDANADGGVGPTIVRVRSLLPPEEAATLQGIFDRFGIRPAACSSQATIAPSSGTWQLTGMGIEPASGSLTDDEAADLLDIFDRLEVAPASSATFLRSDHTDCMPQDGRDQWEVRYDQTE